MMDLDSNLKALKLALKTEEEGYRLYREGAERTGSEFIKSIFGQLFKDELMHMELIKKFYANLNEAESWGKLSEDEKKYKGIKGEFKTIFSKHLDEIKSGDASFSDKDIEVYQEAIDFEKSGVEMYDKFFNETQDDRARKFYAFLRDMEQEHADVLENTFQYLKDPNNWYMQQEGWTLDH